MVLAQMEKRPKYLEDLRLSRFLFFKIPETGDDRNDKGKWS